METEITKRTAFVHKDETSGSDEERDDRIRVIDHDGNLMEDVIDVSLMIRDFADQRGLKLFDKANASTMLYDFCKKKMNI